MAILLFQNHSNIMTFIIYVYITLCRHNLLGYFIFLLFNYFLNFFVNHMHCLNFQDNYSSSILTHLFLIDTLQRSTNYICFYIVFASDRLISINFLIVCSYFFQNLIFFFLLWEWMCKSNWTLNLSFLWGYFLLLWILFVNLKPFEWIGWIDFFILNLVFMCN